MKVSDMQGSAAYRLEKSLKWMMSNIMLIVLH